MKKICHFSSVHKGLEIRIFRKQCVSLAKAGYDTHLVISASEADVTEAAEYGVKVHPFQGASGGRLSRFSRGAWNCYQIARKVDADLYHFHDPELIPYGLLLAREGKKVIYDAHEDLAGDIHSKDWLPLRTRRIVAAASRGFEKFAVRRLSAVVAATPFIGEIFKGIADRVVVVNNYPLLHELPPQFPVESGQRTSVCYVGGIHPQRGIREIIGAVGLAEVPLLLAGMYQTGGLRAELERYPGWVQVREYGFVGRRAVSDIMSASFAGLVIFHPVPNLIRAQPIKMFEYMSAGVPVIASDFPLWRDIIERNECGICVDYSNPARIAEAIGYLRTHPDEVLRMGRNGRRAVVEQYRWDHEEVKLFSLYDALFERKDRTDSEKGLLHAS